MRATLANWRTAPFNRWAFHHVREIVPSADIPNDLAKVAPLASAPQDVPGADRFFAATDGDGLIVMHRGRVLHERYDNGMTPDTPHILMSVSKSMLGLLSGILASRGALELERAVPSIVPELAGTAYEGASVRNLLDMRAGIGFDEDYTATSGPMIAYRKAVGWNPLAPGEEASDLRTFFATLREKDGPHGGRFKYVSPNSDLLGWIIERSTGARYADLMSELLWRPLGCERSAYVTVDRLGAPRCAGGQCVTLRDLARVGQMVLEGGRGIVPESWVADLANGDRSAWSAGNLAGHFPAGLAIGYRSQWYSLGTMVFAWGIHGQHLFVDRSSGMVIAKLSSQPVPVDDAKLGLAVSFAREAGAFFAGR